MTRKSFFFFLINFCSIFLYATLAHAYVIEPVSPVSGFYLSVGGGGITGDFSVQKNYNAILSGNFNIVFSDNLHGNMSSGIGAFALGYEHNIGQYFLLGLEAIADVEHLKYNRAATIVSQLQPIYFSNTVSGKLTNDFALVIKAGFMLTPTTVLSLLVGPRWGHFRNMAQADFSFQQIFASANILAQISSRYKTGTTAGISIEHIFPHRIGLSLEYDYTNYSHVFGSITQTAPIVVAGDGTVGTITYLVNALKVHTHAILLNLVFHFD